jgi:prolyl oligopeptidase
MLSMPRSALVFAALAAFAAGPPPTRVETVKETLHGVMIADPYRWLEDQNSPETRAWIDAQIQYTQSYLARIPRERLKSRLTELRRVDSVGTPTLRGNRYFFTRRLKQENRISICMRVGFSGKDEVIVNPNDVNLDESVSVLLWGVSEDGSILAYGVRKGGEDEVEIRLLDLKTRKLLADALPRARYSSFSLKKDNSGFYYGRLDPEGPRIYYHSLGASPGEDRKIFGDGYTPSNWATAWLSDEDGRWLLISVGFGAAGKTDVFLRDEQAQGPVRPVAVGLDAEFRPFLLGDRLFLWTNYKAPNWRIFSVGPANPAQANWKEIVPEGAAPIEDVDAAGGRLFVHYLENVLPRVKQFDSTGKSLGEFRAPGPGTISGPYGRWSRNEAFFVYSSYLEPGATYRYQVSNGKREVWFRPAIPIKPEDYEEKQVWYSSKDGTRVPMFLVHRKGLKLDGNNPAHLTGYGGFRLSRRPDFSVIAAVVAELGGVFADANLRGGAEFGEKWHRAGMLESKQNVFDDFIGAAEWLIANKYTRPARLAIAGGSNGGLLVGAAMTQRPDLFGAVLCDVPLLDMIRYHKFKLAPLWTPEYGSSEDPQQFAYILKYSPYHNVKQGAKYPAVMFKTGDSDTRVDPLHARKMTALVQASTGSGRAVLLHYDTKAGHSRDKPLDKAIDEQVDTLGFLLHEIGVPLR